MENAKWEKIEWVNEHLTGRPKFNDISGSVSTQDRSSYNGVLYSACKSYVPTRSPKMNLVGGESGLTSNPKCIAMKGPTL